MVVTYIKSQQIQIVYTNTSDSTQDKQRNFTKKVNQNLLACDTSIITSLLLSETRFKIVDH